MSIEHFDRYNSLISDSEQSSSKQCLDHAVVHIVLHMSVSTDDMCQKIRDG